MFLRLGLIAAMWAAVLVGSVRTARADDTGDVKNVARDLTRAIGAGDADAVHKLMTSDAQQVEFADTLTQVNKAKTRFEDACKKRFGSDSLSPPAGAATTKPQDAAAKMIAAIDASTVAVDGDAAQLTFGSDDHNGGAAAKAPPRTMAFKRVDGHWKVDQIAPADQLSFALPHMKIMEKSFQTTADQVDAGKFKTLVDAELALKDNYRNLAKTVAPPAPPPSK
jgi:ketosteroid isomerase-like protein